MPYLSTFVFSEDSKQVLDSNGQGSSLHLVNPQNIFRPMFIPGTYSFSVTLGIGALDITAENTFQLVIRFDKDDSQAVINTGEVLLPKSPQRDPIIPPEAEGIMFNMDFRNAPFKIAGKYIAEVFINKKLIDTKTLYIYPQEQ
ncbi:hypothetical protein QEZ44_00660 [Bacillus cereus]|uniref:hypothetical protein n=1 Tax=Bacillus cereus TaxID=1396 RepID=UPI0024528B46|nr:hypothetical protein [Bacillus cereus]MDH4419971.1 hypothetical protein [Bacillus cereus]